ncbi:MAG: hypothetical protein K2J90_08295 [Lachnospiraceae bacterium]|nr:hypothetical protein [Lachnospiraceae bacterium]
MTRGWVIKIPVLLFYLFIIYVVKNKKDDIKGSSFSKIQARTVKATKNTISLKWNKDKIS